LSPEDISDQMQSVPSKETSSQPPKTNTQQSELAQSTSSQVQYHEQSRNVPEISVTNTSKMYDGPSEVTDPSRVN